MVKAMSYKIFDGVGGSSSGGNVKKTSPQVGLQSAGKGALMAAASIGKKAGNEGVNPVSGSTVGSNINLNVIPSTNNEYQNQLSEQLKAIQAQYASQLQAQQQAKEEAARNAYSSNLSALEQAYQNRISGLDKNIASTKEQLLNAYNNSVSNLNQNAESALQEAYINRMMNEKNLKQQLNAQGINGGASESAIAALLNNYGTSRNNINTSTLNNLRDLETAYNGNVASAMQNYNDAVSDANDRNMQYRMQLESDLANNTVGSYSDLYSALGSMDANYANAMTNLVTNQAMNASDLQAAAYKQMLQNAISYQPKVSSGSDVDSGLSRVNQLKGAGHSTNDIVATLFEEGYTEDQIAQYFMNAGIKF